MNISILKIWNRNYSNDFVQQLPKLCDRICTNKLVLFNLALPVRLKMYKSESNSILMGVLQKNGIIKGAA